MDADGQFRWTPPTHVILAFRQAMLEYELEGGLEGRAARYQANQQVYIYTKSPSNNPIYMYIYIYIMSRLSLL